MAHLHLVSVKNCIWRVHASGLFDSLGFQRLSWAMTESAQAEEEGPEGRAWSPWTGLFQVPSALEQDTVGNLTCGYG